MITMNIMGIDELLRKTGRWDKEVKNTINDAMLEIGKFMAAKIFIEIEKKSPSNGPVYRYTGKRRRIAFPARRGYSPNNDTGKLARSIIYKQRKRELGVTIGSNLKYAPFLEDPKILNRPFLKPTIERNMKHASDMLLKALKNKGMMNG